MNGDAADVVKSPVLSKKRKRCASTSSPVFRSNSRHNRQTRLVRGKLNQSPVIENCFSPTQHGSDSPVIPRKRLKPRNLFVITTESPSSGSESETRRPVPAVAPRAQIRTPSSQNFLSINEALSSADSSASDESFQIKVIILIVWYELTAVAQLMRNPIELGNRWRSHQPKGFVEYQPNIDCATDELGQPDWLDRSVIGEILSPREVQFAVVNRIGQKKKTPGQVCI